jgi:hypothetical protein
MNVVMQDVRYALRMLRKKLGLTAVTFTAGRLVCY